MRLPFTEGDVGYRLIHALHSSCLSERQSGRVEVIYELGFRTQDSIGNIIFSSLGLL